MSENKEKKFEQLFRTYYQELHRSAFRYVRDSESAEEIVQQVFLRLWEKEWEQEVHTSIKAYLYRAVYNESMNLLKKEQRKLTYQSYQLSRQDVVPAVDQSAKDLDQKLQLALAGLPEKSRIVFELSRFQEMKYKDIADTLDLSIKTVEGHMSKALRHLRIELIDYLTVIVFYIIYII
ncbi:MULTISPECIES: RNA polymerase sigma-70 factor [Sphingobacterium]|jgi:RNA polymerase sigma-70 factor (ECF subfamily)|uniref:RNA polymerase sigma-70 factor n=1 Tax=Sphingobacterium TaxID=28453 RepID=UPI0004E5EF62|nr:MULTISPECIES: RNA polymerase sigma-70 factor [Sphingobacterium]CDS98181.1 RNA polymerase sigma-70 factor, ECF subfamily protein [Sphingobacterium sp. PM2-P1-29]HCU45307.1 RNA polymerase sigma-70 factor [Sphingobacterium sp.]UPZ36260.1 RNA polymerase sigma-70 factor [Sphingobacterium sp. PCS056]UXD67863.1 RNA polymerase sigma-70 factor [Sphingobacterium faecium]WGQ15493.1 RNA polymerase sigma-70 factor [Sphingobacterium faecium]